MCFVCVSLVSSHMLSVAQPLPEVSLWNAFHGPARLPCPQAGQLPCLLACAHVLYSNRWRGGWCLALCNKQLPCSPSCTGLDAPSPHLHPLPCVTSQACRMHSSQIGALQSQVIHLVRHGEGFHNVAGRLNHDNYKSWSYEDAHLTEFGWKQVRVFCSWCGSSRRIMKTTLS